jgi:hypothetical protein
MEQTIYQQKKNAFLKKLAARKETTIHDKLSETIINLPPYAQVAMGQSTIDMKKNKYFNEICSMSLWLPDFKNTVFEILESFHFQECTTFTNLLKRWQTYDHARSAPSLSAFFIMTEPKTNKLRFYEAAFDHLTLLNLVEFLAECISNGDLDEDFITSLKNAI